MKNNKGFSLVELIVVIAIMAILAAVAVVSFSVYIDRAEEASDMDYIENVLYRVKLFSTEKGVEVQQVVISPVVDGPDDILMIIGRDDNGNPIYYTGDDRSEIYETVGDYTMHHYQSSIDLGGIVIDPDLPFWGETLPTEHNWVEDTSKYVASTCKTHGSATYTCNGGCGIAGCTATQTVSLPLGGHSGWESVEPSGGYYIWQCDVCGQIVIKSESGNAVVPLPGTPGH